MARIPTEEVERLKSEVSIERLVQARGVVLRKRGDELLGLCPFHEDRSPSLVVNPAKNLWHCLGACQAGGSVVDWVMKAQGVSFRHAVELLRNDAGLCSAPPQGACTPPKVVKRSTVAKLDAVIDKDVDTQSQLRQVIDYYHETLKQSPEALAYLEKRGLQSGEAIDRFKLGYANRTLGYHLPQKNRQAGAEIRGRLESIGVFRQSGHEHFSGSLVIPVVDTSGCITEVYGRKITRGLRKGTPLHLYLPGPHQGVWNIEALEASTEIILCESLIDALTFWCAGFRNVTASYGIEGFTEDHLDAFLSHGIERVLIAYDRDEAGNKAAGALSEKLMAQGMACFRIEFPRGMDANEYAVLVKPAEKSLDLVVRKAMWLGKGRGPKDTKTADATGPAKKATKEGKDIASECRAAVNLPPIPESAESRSLSVGAVREPPGDEPSETTRVVFTGDSRIAPTT
nr:DNA primase [Myxococcota bacterium]